MALNVKPLGDRILVEAVEDKEVKKGGIIIPDTAKEKPMESVVRALGTGKLDDSGKKIPFEIVARRPGDAPALVAEPTKLKTLLGWSPKYLDIRTTIETAWKWHQRYPNGYADKAARGA